MKIEHVHTGQIGRGELMASVCFDNESLNRGDLTLSMKVGCLPHPVVVRIPSDEVRALYTLLKVASRKGHLKCKACKAK